MIWHRQIDFHEFEDGTHKAFHAAIGQMENFLDRQHNQYGLVAIIKLTAALLFSNITPCFFEVICYPECDRTALHQGFVIFRPVLDTV